MRHQDFISFPDKVEFGEVAMEPPSLTAKPRNAPAVSIDTISVVEVLYWGMRILKKTEVLSFVPRPIHFF